MKLNSGCSNAASMSLTYVLTPDGEELYQINLFLNEGKMQFNIGPAYYEYRVTDIGTFY